MPPYFFSTNPEGAERILSNSPEGSAKIYKSFEAQDWMRGAMNDTGEKDQELDITSLDFLANEVTEATLAGNALMHVDVDNREALQGIAVAAQVNIQPLN
jgi:hypothetical protein